MHSVKMIIVHIWLHVQCNVYLKTHKNTLQLPENGVIVVRWHDLI